MDKYGVYKIISTYLKSIKKGLSLFFGKTFFSFRKLRLVYQSVIDWKIQGLNNGRLFYPCRVQ